MRTIYFNDQTKAFIEKEFDIVFLGNLYLKGKPYTNPKEAVDKEYVDNQWDNVTEAQLTKTRFNPKNFPGFNADLVNKEGTNHFTLKKVIRAGKYHKVSIDNRGRAVGGRTGKLKFDSSDFGGIPFNKLYYENYKNSNGVYGKPNKIADFTNRLNTDDYLYKIKNAHIYRPLRIESGPKTEYNIINEDEMLDITNEYFIGEVKNVKERSFYGYGDWGEQISQYPNINMTPWTHQRSFTREVNNQVGPGYRVIYDSQPEIFTNDESWMVSNLVVDGGYLYCPNVKYVNDKPNSWSIKLDNNGKIPNNFQLLRLGGYNKEEKLKFDTQDFIFISNGKYYMRVLYKNPPGSYYGVVWRMTEVDFKDGFIDINLSPIGGTGNGTLFCGNKWVKISGVSWSNSNVREWIDGAFRNYTTLAGNINLSFVDNLSFNGVNSWRNFFNIGSYIYVFPTGGTSGDMVQRIRLVNNVPSGEWEWYNTGLVKSHRVMKVFMVENNAYFVENVNGEINIHRFSIDRRSNIRYVGTVMKVPIKSRKYVTAIALSKGSLFIIGGDYLVEVDFKGTFNDYRHISMDGYVPPHP